MRGHSDRALQTPSRQKVSVRDRDTSEPPIMNINSPMQTLKTSFWIFRCAREHVSSFQVHDINHFAGDMIPSDAVSLMPSRKQSNLGTRNTQSGTRIVHQP